jgi:hypothetical protein
MVEELMEGAMWMGDSRDAGSARAPDARGSVLESWAAERALELGQLWEWGSVSTRAG